MTNIYIYIISVHSEFSLAESYVLLWHTSELKKDWNDNLAAIFEAKLKAAMKAKPPKYDPFSKALLDPLTSCFRAS